MVQKEIIWTKSAVKDKFEILNYWIERNKSLRYSQKLNALFDHTIEQLIHFPEIGRQTDVENVRLRLVRDYKIFYEIDFEKIHILRIISTYANIKV